MIYTVRKIIQNTHEGVKKYEFKEECLEFIKKYENNHFQVDRCGKAIKLDMSYTHLDYAVKQDNQMMLNDAIYQLECKSVGFVEKFFEWRRHGDAYYKYKDTIEYIVHTLGKELNRPYVWQWRSMIENFPDDKRLPKHKDFRKYIQYELVKLNKVLKKKIHNETLMLAIYEYREQIKKDHMRLLNI